MATEVTIETCIDLLSASLYTATDWMPSRLAVLTTLHAEIDIMYYFLVNKISMKNNLFLRDWL